MVVALVWDASLTCFSSTSFAALICVALRSSVDVIVVLKMGNLIKSREPN